MPGPDQVPPGGLAVRISSPSLAQNGPAGVMSGGRSSVVEDFSFVTSRCNADAYAQAPSDQEADEMSSFTCTRYRMNNGSSQSLQDPNTRLCLMYLPDKCQYLTSLGRVSAVWIQDDPIFSGWRILFFQIIRVCS